MSEGESMGWKWLNKYSYMKFSTYNSTINVKEECLAGGNTALKTESPSLTGGPSLAVSFAVCTSQMN